MPAALLHSPDHGWLALDRPGDILAARTIDDVRPCLLAAEAAARTGAYVAGLVTYEAGAAFGLAVREPPYDGLPLAWFGVFPPDRVSRVDRPAPRETGALAWTPSIDRSGYLRAVERVRTHIADGDTYQLNFTFRHRARFSGDPLGLFERLVAAQRGPWSGYLDLGSHAICSASPELFFDLRGGVITCRPMKGTIARGLWPAADGARAEALRASAKNRSENVMIVDLMRNDLGRIARVGSVEVASLFDVERYPAQWQMTSTVTADVAGVALADIFAALFPSGSVTGAPKARSMEIICGLEDTPRGIYTGAIGLVEPSGRAHFNVAIRTVTVDRARGEAEFGVGSGLVWQSNAEEEFEECRLKAAILTNRLPDFDLLETLKWDPAEGYVLLERHLERLMASASYFGGTIVRDAVVAELDRVVTSRPAAARVRLLVSLSGNARAEASDLPSRVDSYRVALAASPVSRDEVFLYHKTTNRGVYDRARASRPDADEVILWNEDEQITEAINANVVVEIEGRKVTPPTECGLLAGTMRAELLARGEIEEGVISTMALAGATQIWLINSVRGWMRARINT